MRLLILAAVVTLAYGHNACPPLWTHLGDNCYRFFPDRLRWEDAKTTCGQFAPCSAAALGQLAIIPDAQVNEFIGIYLNTFVPQPPATEIWISPSDIGLEGTYTNTDGTPVVFTNWAQGQPDNGRGGGAGGAENCVLFSGETKQWSDASCAMMMPYMCMMPAEQERFPRFVPPMNPNNPNIPINPNNPNVPGQPRPGTPGQPRPGTPGQPRF